MTPSGPSTNGGSFTRTSTSSSAAHLAGLYRMPGISNRAPLFSETGSTRMATPNRRPVNGASASSFERLRVDNLLIERTAEACARLRDIGRGLGVEQPLSWLEAVSMFHLKCFRNLQERGADLSDLDQCMHGGDSRKPTRVFHWGVTLVPWRPSAHIGTSTARGGPAARGRNICHCGPGCIPGQTQ
jgi:hypothetical protein